MRRPVTCVRRRWLHDSAFIASAAQLPRKRIWAYIGWQERIDGGTESTRKNGSRPDSRRNYAQGLCQGPIEVTPGGCSE